MVVNSKLKNEQQLDSQAAGSRTTGSASPVSGVPAADEEPGELGGSDRLLRGEQRADIPHPVRRALEVVIFDGKPVLRYRMQSRIPSSDGLCYYG